jgi:cobalt-zinc-cadmium efflux system protein
MSDHGHHDHGHHHHHHHVTGGSDRAYLIAIALNLGFVIVEAAYGFMSGSLALLADAGHNLSDVAGLGIAWMGTALARRGPTQRYTYGLRSSSILAAFGNSLLLVGAAAILGWHAIERIMHPAPVIGTTMMVVAAIGIVINLGSAWLFHESRHNDLNARGAYLHMAADAAVSLGVVVAGAIVWATGATWVDPIASLAIVAVIVAGTWGLLRDSFALALQAVPAAIDPVAVRELLVKQPGVIAVHDLHIWAMGTNTVALTAHLVHPAGHPGDAFLARVSKELHERFGIDHATVQIEVGDPAHPCDLAPDHVV